MGLEELQNVQEDLVRRLSRTSNLIDSRSVHSSAAKRAPRTNKQSKSPPTKERS